jgi:hypothetical protein
MLFKCGYKGLKNMKIESKPKRVLVMSVIGVVLALIQLAIGMKPSGALIGGVLFFVWIWLGGKWN